jgi:hypothetical protein
LATAAEQVSAIRQRDCGCGDAVAIELVGLRRNGGGHRRETVAAVAPAPTQTVSCDDAEGTAADWRDPAGPAQRHPRSAGHSAPTRGPDAATTGSGQRRAARSSHLPRVCHSCRAPIRAPAETCPRCGATWAPEPRAALRLIEGGAPPAVRPPEVHVSTAERIARLIAEARA